MSPKIVPSEHQTCPRYPPGTSRSDVDFSGAIIVDMSINAVFSSLGCDRMGDWTTGMYGLLLCRMRSRTVHQMCVVSQHHKLGGDKPGGFCSVSVVPAWHRHVWETSQHYFIKRDDKGKYDACPVHYLQSGSVRADCHGLPAQQGGISGIPRVPHGFRLCAHDLSELLRSEPIAQLRNQCRGRDSSRLRGPRAIRFRANVGENRKHGLDCQRRRGLYDRGIHPFDDQAGERQSRRVACRSTPRVQPLVAGETVRLLSGANEVRFPQSVLLETLRRRGCSPAAILDPLFVTIMIVQTTTAMKWSPTTTVCSLSCGRRSSIPLGGCGTSARPLVRWMLLFTQHSRCGSCWESYRTTSSCVSSLLLETRRFFNCVTQKLLLPKRAVALSSEDTMAWMCFWAIEASPGSFPRAADVWENGMEWLRQCGKSTG